MRKNIEKHQEDLNPTLSELQNLERRLEDSVEVADGIIKRVSKKVEGSPDGTWETRFNTIAIHIIDTVKRQPLLDTPILVEDIEDLLEEDGEVIVQVTIDDVWWDVTISLNDEGTATVHMQKTASEDLPESADEVDDTPEAPAFAPHLEGDIPDGEVWELRWNGVAYAVVYTNTNTGERGTLHVEYIDPRDVDMQYGFVLSHGEQQYLITVAAKGDAPRKVMAEKYTPRITNMIPLENAPAGWKQNREVDPSDAYRLVLRDPDGKIVFSVLEGGILKKYPGLKKSHVPVYIKKGMMHKEKMYDITAINYLGQLKIDIVEIGEGIRSVQKNVAFANLAEGQEFARKAVYKDGAVMIADENSRELYRFGGMESLADGARSTPVRRMIAGERWELSVSNKQTVGTVHAERLSGGVYQLGKVEARSIRFPGPWTAELVQPDYILLLNAYAGTTAIDLTVEPWKELNGFGTVVEQEVDFDDGSVKIVATNTAGVLSFVVTEISPELDEKEAERGDVRRCGEHILDGIAFRHYSDALTKVENGHKADLNAVYIHYHDNKFKVKLHQFAAEWLADNPGAWAIPQLQWLNDKMDPDDKFFDLDLSKHVAPDYTYPYVDVYGNTWGVKAFIHPEEVDGVLQGVLRVQLEPPTDRESIEELIKDKKPKKKKKKKKESGPDGGMERTDDGYRIYFPEFPDWDEIVVTTEEMWKEISKRIGEIADDAALEIEDMVSNEKDFDDNKGGKIDNIELDKYDKRAFPLGTTTKEEVEDIYIKQTKEGVKVMDDIWGYDTKLFEIDINNPKNNTEGTVKAPYTREVNGQNVTSQVTRRYRLVRETIARNGYESQVLRVLIDPPPEYRGSVEYKEDTEALAKGFAWPVEEGKETITGHFNEPRGTHYHAGIDIDTEIGDTVYSAHDGVVVSVTWNSDKNGDGDHTNDGYGYYMVVRHKVRGQEYYTLYGHLKANSNLYKEGDTVRRGQKIAEAGNTGYSTGSHLHFEVRPYDPDAAGSEWSHWDPVDPLIFYNKSSKSTPEYLDPSYKPQLATPMLKEETEYEVGGKKYTERRVILVLKPLKEQDVQFQKSDFTLVYTNYSKNKKQQEIKEGMETAMSSGQGEIQAIKGSTFQIIHDKSGDVVYEYTIE